MNIKAMANVVTSTVARQGIKVQKHSPTIMFASGVVGVVTTVVLASKATLKLEETLEETNQNVAKAKRLVAAERDDYTPEDYKKDMALTYVKSAVNVAKLYAPAFTVGMISVALLTGAHVTLNRRNAGMMAAYAALDKGFKEFESRVRNELGEEKTRELRFGSEEVEIFEEAENGEPIVKRVKRAEGHSIYAKFFDEFNPNWEPTPEYNLIFIKAQQNMMNDRLQARGHVLLNDVYDGLGMERTKEGCVVGWVKDSKVGNGYIDFGIWGEDHMSQYIDFMSGREGAILLDFNVDGVVYDLI